LVKATQRGYGPKICRQKPPGSTRVDPNLVEPWSGLAQVPIRSSCQQGDMVGRVMQTNGREGAEGMHNIAECAELDDGDTSWTSAEGRAVLGYASWGAAHAGALTQTMQRWQLFSEHGSVPRGGTAS
jgi:hypothetical protein